MAKFSTNGEADVNKIVNDFFSKFSKKIYVKNGTILAASDEPRGVFYIEKGVVRQYAISLSGEELTINIFKKGAIFPMGWVVNDTLSTHYFDAMSDVAVFVAPKKVFMDFLTRNPIVLFDLVKRIYRGLEGYFIRMELSLLGTAKEKLITELIIYGKRFGAYDGKKVDVDFRLTEKELAVQSGIARETASRELQKLKKDGLIIFNKKKLIIPNIENLEKELN